VNLGQAGSEISISLSSGPRPTTKRTLPVAPVRSNGPSMIGTPAVFSRAITSASEPP
jgi:hypothetical protein